MSKASDLAFQKKAMAFLTRKSTMDAKRAWQELLDKDDRTSPAEYPEMCLITFDELRDFMMHAKR